mmetsp:Transcript_9032/g.19565  ORF Transcript_9032/g.19565 Transcript_9032/m.19565 type:complete len:808 (-) Transcript_9032:62-2485(-)
MIVSMSTENISSSSSDGVDCNGGPITSTSVTGIATDTSMPPDVQKKKHKKRKASKGRLKKLWRRALGPPPGLSSRSEWLELANLHSDWKLHHVDIDKEQIGGGGEATDHKAMLGPLPGPSVILTTLQARHFSKVDDWQVTEGSDHRDLIMNLLFGEGGGNNGETNNSSTTQQKKKKRKASLTSKKDENKCHGRNSLATVPPLASWATIANAGSVGGLAVVEIEIVGGEKDATCPLMPSQRIMDTLDAKTTNVWSSLLQQNSHEDPFSGNDDANKVERTIGAACKVKLFQGNKQPRCLSDVIMFLPPPPAEIEKQQNGCVDLFRAMHDLLLKPKQMLSEGFPIEANIASDHNSGTLDERLDAKTAKERVCKMSVAMASGENMQIATEDDALELVRALSVDVVLEESTKDRAEPENNDDFSKIEYYVKSHAHDQELDGDSKRQPKIFSMDCEMVQTSSGPELARVSVIMFTGGCDENAKAVEKEKSVVVLDEIVKPRRKVLNYLTEYSGITPHMLQNVDTRIEHIQLHLLSLIDKDDILIGHSLENDLRALRLVHGKIVDTSVTFRGINGRKFSLRHLSNVLLQKKIQQGCGGHCSTEDAQAALVLALRRARRGNSFGLKEGSKRQKVPIVFQKVNQEAKDKGADSESFAERNNGSCVCIGPNAWISKFASDGAHHVLSCESITDSMSMAVPSWLSSDKSSKRAGLLWANLRCEDRSADGKGRWKNEVNKLDEIVKALVDRVPYDIPILLLFQRNYQKASALTQQRKAASNPKATCGWTSVQEIDWQKLIEQSKQCEAIWIGSGAPVSS